MKRSEKSFIRTYQIFFPFIGSCLHKTFLTPKDRKLYLYPNNRFLLLKDFNFLPSRNDCLTSSKVKIKKGYMEWILLFILGYETVEP